MIEIKWNVKALKMAKERTKNLGELAIVAGLVAYLAGVLEAKWDTEKAKQFILDCGFDVREKEGNYYPKYP